METSEGNHKQRLPLRGYLLINVLVWIYSLAMMLLAKGILRDLTGMGFVSIALPVGFALVSLFDFFYDRLQVKEESVKSGVCV